MQFYKNPHQSQQKAQQNKQIDAWTNLHIESIINELTPTERSILNKTIWMDRVWRIVKPSQEYIGRKSGVVRETANRALKKLVELGFIHKKRRYNTTCIYTVNDYFKQPHIRKKLAKLLPAIVVFSLSLLQSTIQSSMSHHITKIFIKNIYRHSVPLYISIEDDPKKESKMNNALPIVKGLPLTRYGQLKLCVYPEEAIRYAEIELAKAKDIRSPLGFVHSKCKEYCLQKGLKIDWRKRYEYMEEGETFQENEPELQRVSTLKDSLSVKPSATEESPQAKMLRPNGLHCHQICNRNLVSRCIFGYIEHRRQESAQHKLELEERKPKR